MKHRRWSTGLVVTGDGSGVAAHAGSAAVRLLADKVGLTDDLSRALTRRSKTPRHDRGGVLRDVAVMIADGGEAISDIDVLRHQGGPQGALGAVASPATVWRMLDELSPGRMRKIATGRARTRRRVWAGLPGGVPRSRVAGKQLDAGVVVLDVDATVVVAHSEKEQAAPTFKKTFGYHPLGVWCDNSGEFLAAMLRTGKAGSNTAADHVAVLSEAIAQVPGTHRKQLLIRCDGAGASHDLVAWLQDQNQVRGRRVEYSVGFAITEHLRTAISQVPKQTWAPAIDADGEVRAGGDVVEITGLLDSELLAKWPAGMRVIVRRERPHPGAQLSLFEEADGWRYQAFVTNTQRGQLAFLEARHRAHARVEDRIRHAKDSGLGRFPSREFAINTAWLLAVQIAADLIAWLRLIGLDQTALAFAEPKALRYRLLHVPARLTRSSRRRHLRIPTTWPWAADVVKVFARIAAIPQPA